MTDIEKLMSLSPKNLAQQQYDGYLEFIENRLQKFVSHLKAKDYIAAEAMLFESPSGDGWGLDSTCINFRFSHEQDPVDAGAVVEILKRLDGIQSSE